MKQRRDLTHAQLMELKRLGRNAVDFPQSDEDERWAKNELFNFAHSLLAFSRDPVIYMYLAIGSSSVEKKVEFMEICCRRDPGDIVCYGILMDYRLDLPGPKEADYRRAMQRIRRHRSSGGQFPSDWKLVFMVAEQLAERTNRQSVAKRLRSAAERLTASSD